MLADYYRRRPFTEEEKVALKKMNDPVSQLQENIKRLNLEQKVTLLEWLRNSVVEEACGAPIKQACLTLDEVAKLLPNKPEWEKAMSRKKKRK